MASRVATWTTARAATKSIGAAFPKVVAARRPTVGRRHAMAKTGRLARGWGCTVAAAKASVMFKAALEGGVRRWQLPAAA
jgi:hypothetical protein